MRARSNGHCAVMVKTRGRNEELGNYDNLYHVINEWRAIRCTHCPSVVQVPRSTAVWARTEPSWQKLFQTSSRRTARLPATSQDFRVAVWLLLCVCACSARFRGLLPVISNSYCETFNNVRPNFTYICGS